MPTLTPTKAGGATAKANDVVYVEPAQTTTDQDLATQVAIDGMNSAFVADLLSAYLTHERCGTHLYRSVAARTNNPVLRSKYEEFGDETLRHVEILEGLITSAGGNPAYVSPLARAVEGADSHSLQATYLAAGGIDPMAQEMAMLDAVFMAESVDHANWQALGHLAGKLPKGPIREAMQAAVDEVESDEDKHLGWARDTRAQLTMLQASSSMMAKAGAKAEEVVAVVKDWFSGNGSKQAAVKPPPKRTAAAAKKATAKKSTTRKATAKKGAVKKGAAKKGPAKRSTAKTATAKRESAKRATAKRSTTKKAPAKKTAAKKTAAKKTTAKKTAGNRSSRRR